MTIAAYCKAQGMNIDAYNQFKQNIENTAAAIIQNVKSLYTTDTGMYYPINDIINPVNTNDNMKCFIIQALKNKVWNFSTITHYGGIEP